MITGELISENMDIIKEYIKNGTASEGKRTRNASLTLKNGTGTADCR